MTESREYAFMQDQLEQKKRMLLTRIDKPAEVPFLFSTDSFLQAQDPTTYRLMDHMMRMSDFIDDADSYLAENGGYPPTQNGDIRSLFNSLP